MRDLAEYDALKRSLLTDLSGTVVEIGAGTGANFGLLPGSIRWLRDQARVLAEVRRVLRPGGAFVFCEHVAAPRGTLIRARQRAMAPLTRRFDAGCDPARETWRAIEQAGFSLVGLEWFTIPPRWSLYNPRIVGRAVA